MRHLLMAAVAAVWLSPLAASAHTKDDENACRPDVMRLCSSQIPNRARIVACLESNKPRLSPACYRVFDRNANPQPTPARAEPQPMQWGR